jgi:ABC-2 type transport system permease protein
LRWVPSVDLGVVHALVRRDYLVSRSYRLAMLLDVFFGVLSLLVYYFISRVFNDATTPALAGAPSYFAFASVGVALTLVVQVASISVARRVREEQLTGTLEAVVAQPVTTTEMSLGLVGFHFFFAMARATFYILLAWIFFGVDLSAASWPGYVIVLLAATLAMSGLGISLAAAVLVFKRADALVSVLTLTLGFIGGAFFPVAVLPGWLEPLARVIPTRFVFEGARAALFGRSVWAGDALWLALFGLVALPVSIALFAGALEAAKRRGSLATY